MKILSFFKDLLRVIYLFIKPFFVEMIAILVLIELFFIIDGGIIHFEIIWGIITLVVGFILVGKFLSR